MLKYQVRPGGSQLQQQRQRRKSLLPALNGSFDTEYEDMSTVSSSPTPSASTSNSSSSNLPSANVLLRHRGRSMSISSLSSAASASSSSEPGLEWGTIRVYTHLLRSDCDYKTLFISTANTAEEVVNLVLAKFRKIPRDPNLFYLTMELDTLVEGKMVTNLLVLDSHARPLELLACHPKGKARFVLQARKGDLIRIYDNFLFPDFNYKSLLISGKTTCREVIVMLLQSYKMPLSPHQFAIALVETRSKYEKLLHSEEIPLALQSQNWFSREHQFHLRPVKMPRSSFRIPKITTVDLGEMQQTAL